MKLNLGRFWSCFPVGHKALLRHICTGAIVFVTVIIIPDDWDNQVTFVKKTAHQRPAGSHRFFFLQTTNSKGRLSDDDGAQICSWLIIYIYQSILDLYHLRNGKSFVTYNKLILKTVKERHYWTLFKGISTTK